MNQIYCTSRCNKRLINSALLQRDRQCRIYAPVSTEAKDFLVERNAVEGLWLPKTAQHILLWIEIFLQAISLKQFMIFFYLAQQPPVGHGLLFHEVSSSHKRRTTVGRTPLDEWSARRRDLYLTTHNTHNRETSKSPAGFEHTISAGERPQITP
jgi:hypothetical protein